MGTLKLIMELEAGLALVLVVYLDTLVYWVRACKLTRYHLLVTSNNCTNILKISVS